MDVLAAIADPVRRDILARLHTRSMTAGDIADCFPISRPAISRHLRILREVGLVSVMDQGRTRVYRFEPAPLADVDAWLGQYRDLWTSRFDALETEVFRTRRQREREEAAQAEGPTSTGSSIALGRNEGNREKTA